MIVDNAPLGITCGDPAGVGPEIALRCAAMACASDRLVIYGDATYLTALAASMGFGLCDVCSEPRDAQLGRVGLVHVSSWSSASRLPKPTAESGLAQFATLERAIDDALGGHIRGLVTGPMSKAAVNLAGQPFVGHTEHLAHRAGLQTDDVTMMFLGPRLRLALVTTHLAVRDVPQAITQRRVARSTIHLGPLFLFVVQARCAVLIIHVVGRFLTI